MYDEEPIEEISDVSSDPTAEGHLPVAGEIIEEDDQISNDIIDELNGETDS
jgi:hypothetical protein